MQPTLETQQQTQFQSWIEIDHNALSHNIESIQNTQLEDKAIMAIVKANAYGHGLQEISKIISPSVDILAVTDLREAQQLKQFGIQKPIFILSKLVQHEISEALEEGFSLGISSFEEASIISEEAQKLSRTATIHIKIDTGMGRLGIPFRYAMPTIKKIVSLKRLHVEGLYSHLPNGETEDDFTLRQIKDFDLLIKALQQEGISFSVHHIANSLGMLEHKETNFNMIRPGLTLYGIYPRPSLKQQIDVKPVLSLKSKIMLVKYLKIGESTGYGREFIAERPTTLGIIPIGYSHGYPFQASHKASVLFRGQKRPIVGRISMDYMAIDLGDVVAEENEAITLIGSEGENSIRVEDIALWANTLPYEIVTRLATHIPRIII